MKRITKNLFIMMLACLIMITGNMTVNASTGKFGSAEEVFLEEQVNQIKDIIRNQPIYQDKDMDGNFSLNVTRANNEYPTRYGVILVTEDKFKGLIPTGHAAIIWTSGAVIESLQNGVVIGPNDWNKSKSSCYGISVRGTTCEQDNKASNWCQSQCGKPYNYNYLNVSTRKKFYCSQLVWAAYMDKYGIDLDTSSFGNAIHPIELVNSSKTYTIYRK